MNNVILSIALDFPIFVPNQIATGRRAGLIVEPSVDALAKMKSFPLDVREGEMGHVEIGENDGVILIFLVLPIAHPEAKESNLIAVALAALSLQVTRVVPPLRHRAE